jgi:mono/diheme cytochrome c family protein
VSRTRGAVGRRSAPLLAVVAALVACSTRSPTADGGRDEGAQLYRRACASCHGIDARGGGPVAAALRVAPPDLTRLAESHGGSFPRRYVLDVIAGREASRAHGTREMPVWGDRFGDGVGLVASLWTRRRAELLGDHLEAVQR